MKNAYRQVVLSQLLRESEDLVDCILLDASPGDLWRSREARRLWRRIKKITRIGGTDLMFADTLADMLRLDASPRDLWRSREARRAWRQIKKIRKARDRYAAKLWKLF